LKGFIEKVLKRRADERAQLSVEKRQVARIDRSPSDIAVISWSSAEPFLRVV
jgi:hypothetical protein